MGKLVFQATLGGQVNLVGPNTASTYDINVPAVAGNMVTTGDTGTVTNTMLAGSIANAKLTNSSVTIGSTSVALGATAATVAGLTLTTPVINGFTGDTSVINVGSGQFYKDTSGNVGIGTASPTGKLTVSNGTITGVVNPNSGLGAFAFGTTTNHPIQFITNNTAQGLYQDTSGNVGIGTSSPTAPLTVKTNSSYAGQDIIGDATNGWTSVRFRNAANSATSVFFNYDNAAFKFGTVGAEPVVFNTTNTERARIDSSGNLLVGATSQINADKVGITFNGQTQNGIVFKTTYASTGSDYNQFYNSAGTLAGRITQNGTTTVAYTTSSDYRLKEDIQPMTDALAKVAALKPCTYKWKSSGSDGEGFIAHELAEIFPNAVTGEKDAVDAEGNPQYQGIDTSFLVATLTAAIQEQQAIITEQSEAIAALKARIEVLEAK